MDLSTHYLGLALKNPFVAGSSVLCKQVDSARLLEDAGASAIVMHSLFQEDVERERGLEHNAAAAGDLFAASRAIGALDDYLAHLERLKSALDIPVIASVNGTSGGPWLDCVDALAALGADALELNIYDVAVNPFEASSAVDERALALFRDTRRRVSLPVGVKLSPYYSSLGNLARALEAEGADGLTLFNRFYQPNIDIYSLSHTHTMELSNSQDALLATHWIAILYGRVQLSLAATGGIQFAEDVIKALLCGADVAYLGSTLLANGIEQLGSIREGTRQWLEQNNFASLQSVRGLMSQASAQDPSVFARGHYMQMLGSYES